MSSAEFNKKAKKIIKEAAGWEIANNLMEHGPQYLAGFGDVLSNAGQQLQGSGAGLLGKLIQHGGAVKEHAPAFLKAMAGHRLLDALVSSKARSWELMEPYYANMSREGIQAALSGQDMMPKYRQGIGTAAFNPSVSGLGDYEISKEIAKKLIEQHERETGHRMTSLDEIRNHPKVKAVVEKAQPGVLKSELSQNFLRALDSKLEPNPVVEYLKTPGRFGIGGIGPDNQRHAGRIGLAGAAMLGGGLGGVHGAAVNSAVQAPEYLAASALGKPHNAIAQKLLNFGINLKKSVLGQGKMDAIRRLRGAADPLYLPGGITVPPKTVEALKSTGYHGLNQLSGELYNLGRDAGTVGALYRDADPMTAAAAGLPSAEQRHRQVDSAADHVYKEWQNPTRVVPANTSKNPGFLDRLKSLIGGNKTTTYAPPPGVTDFRSYMDPSSLKPKALPAPTAAYSDPWHGFDLSSVSPHPMDSPATRVLSTGKIIKSPQKMRKMPI